MLVGLATCDALGTTNEFCSPGQFEPIDTIVGAGPFNLEPGQWTDDTSMALCLADSLLACGRYDSLDVMSRYAAWAFEGYRSSTGECFDIGNQVSHAIHSFQRVAGGLVSADEARTKSAGNGAIMRLAPVIIAGFEGRNPLDIVRMARLSARETHFSVEAEAATEVFAALLVGAMQGLGKENILDVSWAKSASHWPECFDVVSGQTISRDPQVRASSRNNTSGYVIHGIALAVWGAHGL